MAWGVCASSSRARALWVYATGRGWDRRGIAIARDPTAGDIVPRGTRATSGGVVVRVCAEM